MIAVKSVPYIRHVLERIEAHRQSYLNDLFPNNKSKIQIQKSFGVDWIFRLKNKKRHNNQKQAAGSLFFSVVAGQYFVFDSTQTQL